MAAYVVNHHTMQINVQNCRALRGGLLGRHMAHMHTEPEFGRHKHPICRAFGAAYRTRLVFDYGEL